MQHCILRCRHCNKEYTYCTYGNGPEYGTEEGCSREYCAECQKAIDKALEPIKKKFEPRLKEINDPELLEKLNLLKELHPDDNGGLGICIYEPENSDYDIIETYYYSGRKYKVKYYDGHEGDKHLFAYAEYDLINKCFTDKLWRYKETDSYRRERNFCKDMADSFRMLSLSAAQKLPQPTGEIFWMNFDFNK